MKKYFQVKALYDKPFREGEEPKPNKPETYLVDALSFTEAESRIINELTPYAIGGIEVKSVTKSSVTEIIGDGLHVYWYKAKVGFLSIDNDNKKRVVVTYIVNEDSFKEAYDFLNRFLTRNATPDEYDIISLSESPILDVYKYQEPLNNETL